MQVKDVLYESGALMKFTITGSSICKTRFFVARDRNDSVLDEYELSLTLNGTYLRTPSGSYNSVHQSSQVPVSPNHSNSVYQGLSYQVILSLKQPNPSAEFQVFKFHESPAISTEDVGRFGVMHADFERLSIQEPKYALSLIEAQKLSSIYPRQQGISTEFRDTSSGVTRFLSTAKKCTKIEFEVDGSDRDQRNSYEVYDSIVKNFQDPSSPLRRGGFSFFAENSKVSQNTDTRSSNGHIQRTFEPRQSTPPPAGPPPSSSLSSPVEFPYPEAPRPMSIPSSGLSFPAATVVSFDQASRLGPAAVDKSGDRIAELEHELNRLKNSEKKAKEESIQALAAAEEKEKRLKEALMELDSFKRITGRDESQLKLAKEMWLKESSRATKLNEKLDKAEINISDLEIRVENLMNELKLARIENQNLKYLVDAGENNAPVQASIASPPPLSFNTNNIGFAQSSQKLVLDGRSSPATTPMTLPATNALLFSSPMTSTSPLNKITNISNIDLRGQSFTRSNLGVAGSPPLSSSLSVPITPPPLLGNAEKLYRNLCIINDAILYEDDVIQIGVKAQYPGLGEGVVNMFYGNKTGGVLQNFVPKFSAPEQLILQVSAFPAPSRLLPKQQISQRVRVQVLGAFKEPPRGQIQFLLPDNTPRYVPLKLPIVMNKFICAKDLNNDQFFSNWRSQRFQLNEVSSVVNVGPHASIARVARFASLGGSLKLNSQIDESPENLVFSGKFPAESIDGVHCATIPEALILVRVEMGGGQHKGKGRVSVRSDDSVVAEAVLEEIMDQLATVSFADASTHSNSSTFVSSSQQGTSRLASPY